VLRVVNISNMKMLIPVPANSTHVSSSASGGGLYPGSTALVGSNVVLTVPGPIPGGATYTPPQVTINVTATAPGSVTSKYAGTGYSNPGMTFTTRVDPPLFPPSDVPTAGYPDPSSPTLTHHDCHLTLQVCAGQLVCADQLDGAGRLEPPHTVQV
jgi:dehydratase